MWWKPKNGIRGFKDHLESILSRNLDNKVEGKIIVTMCVIENIDEVAPLSLGATCTTKISRTDLRVMK